MGVKESKQFLLFHHHPILLHTLRVFETHPEVEEIVVVTRENEIGRVKQLIAQDGLMKVKQVVAGGKERQESVYRGLTCLTTEWVLVHDAVRPFVSHASISRLLTTARMHGAAILAVPVKDTVKQVDQAGIVEMTPDRSRLWAVQTPQAFRTQILLEAHEQASGQEAAATDDSMLVEQLGIDVRVVEGEYTNIKLTTPDDLIVAEAIYQIRQS
ncbi:2-C-methyl-D-erythritol 4-phosphate cytidylyltransferase [Paenactinomyces guangxiensis]|uniref:2-C-methyl-D-erythritol 4-phosphate cytidylyltransferase n=2 Tax=Paenactinomyces guangxiensis TaxID=1490290 RepID=A0A7W1WTM2_9BACL|nr:2-C-methyl-D-erythritol 4-phosphate cytidylyltransferase [Paenactinomyces guangxiensis]MBA4495863.1 2-C-methyl-D-erythritol 4-phosphate cytidylyltransferase [Paenactinomyces guangxiensis]MBH8593000.1 2-C-methyl-D-erythritol 4-phosphate cytidylyltransferase [Paenactinomyces guangxiensis]